MSTNLISSDVSSCIEINASIPESAASVVSEEIFGSHHLRDENRIVSTVREELPSSEVSITSDPSQI